MSHKQTSNHLRLVSHSTERSVNNFAAPSRSRYSSGANSTRSFDSIIGTLKHHFPEYLMEAWGLALFMISACAFGVLLQHPSSPVQQAIPNATLRQVLMGAAMGLTNIVNIYSPWGKRSGAHLNPSVTWTFFRLGKVKSADAVFYAISQFIGGIAGVLIARVVLIGFVAHPAVNYVATIPGPGGPAIAFVAEVIISFILMLVVLSISNNARLSRFTGWFASALVMLYISVEAPLSGMSMNPARTFGSALSANLWTVMWIYFVAPPVGMLLAAEVYLRFDGKPNAGCAKLHHQNPYRCIFCGKPRSGDNA
jgi:aquaporin Z